MAASGRDMAACEALAGLPVPGARFFCYVGVLAACWWGVRAAWRLMSAARVWVVGRGTQVGPGLGRWAVVTGATDGIGKAYAEELAQRGMSIVLISRSQEKLDEEAKNIREKFNVETKVIAADFGKPAEIYGRIEVGLKGLEIGVLVNNVGVSYEYPEYFLDIPDLDNLLDKLINVNITSVCKMTRLVMPGMLERSKGVILNISSASGLYPVPLMTVYSATKAFVDFFSRALHAEYRNKGITVQSVLPFFVATKMSKIRKPTWDKPSPEHYVRSALNTVGLQSRTNGYPAHALLGWISESLLPSCLTTRLSIKMNTRLRARFLKWAKKN